VARQTVLVVDDEPLVRGLVRAVLEGDGYTVVEADGALEALELARSHPQRIDLVLTDVQMPHMLGTQLAPLLRASRPGVPVLFMSASHASLEAPPEPLLEKPFTRDALGRAVREALAQPRAA
jgi:CheY-like chemotaxis protein